MGKKISNILRSTVDMLRERLFSWRRSSSRIFLPDVQLGFEIQNGKCPPLHIRVLDMSASGLRLECDLVEPYERGHRLRFQFSGPGIPRTVRIEAVVRHCAGYFVDPLYPWNRYQLGCEFVFLDPKTRALLAEWSANELTGFLDRKKPLWRILGFHRLVRRVSDWRFHPAASFDQIQRGFHLLYAEYLRRGYIRENPYETFFHFHSLLPHTRIFMGTNRAGKAGGTISLIPDVEGYGLPADEVFRDQIDRLRTKGRRIGEVGMLAIDRKLFPSHSSSLGNFAKMKFLYGLYRIMFNYARHVLDLDDLVIMVNPRHASIYKRLQFHRMGNLRSYAGVNHAPAVFMRMDIRDVEKRGRLYCPILYEFFLGKKRNGPYPPKYALRAPELERVLEWDQKLHRLQTIEKKILRTLYPKGDLPEGAPLIYHGGREGLQTPKNLS